MPRRRRIESTPRIGAIARLAVLSALMLVLVTALMPVGSSDGSETARMPACVEQPGAADKAMAESCRRDRR